MKVFTIYEKTPFFKFIECYNRKELQIISSLTPLDLERLNDFMNQLITDIYWEPPIPNTEQHTRNAKLNKNEDLLRMSSQCSKALTSKRRTITSSACEGDICRIPHLEKMWLLTHHPDEHINIHRVLMFLCRYHCY